MAQSEEERKRKAREYAARYRKAHPEKVQAYRNKAKAANSFKHKLWRRNNPEKVKAIQKRYTERHPDRVIASRKKAYIKGRDNHLKQKREKYRADPESHRRTYDPQLRKLRNRNARLAQETLNALFRDI